MICCDIEVSLISKNIARRRKLVILIIMSCSACPTLPVPPVITVMAVLCWQSSFDILVLTDLFWQSCLACRLLPAPFCPSNLPVLSRFRSAFLLLLIPFCLSHVAYPTLPVLFCLSCSFDVPYCTCFPVLIPLPGCPILVVRFWLSFSGFPVLANPHCPFSGRSVQVVLLWISCPVRLSWQPCPVSPVLFCQICPDDPALAILSWPLLS
jgi:hypothetical protein